MYVCKLATCVCMSAKSGFLYKCFLNGFGQTMSGTPSRGVLHLRMPTKETGHEERYSQGICVCMYEYAVCTCAIGKVHVQAERGVVYACVWMNVLFVHMLYAYAQAKPSMYTYAHTHTCIHTYQQTHVCIEMLRGFRTSVTPWDAQWQLYV